MHVMNEPRQNVDASVPTPEQTTGQVVRLLRQKRGWSQQDVAEKMRPYGYKWSQATVTRLESASRPIRVNELADLAMLFDVAVSQFLDSRILEFDRDDLEALEREIADLVSKRAHLQADLDAQTALVNRAAGAAASLSADVARVEARLMVLEHWAARFKEIGLEAPRKDDGRE